MDTTQSPASETPAASLDGPGLVQGLMDLSFTRFITIRVVRLLYILMLLAIALEWLVGVVSLFNNPIVQGFAAFLGFLFLSLVVIVQTIFARVGLELVVVLFRIGENTTTIANRGA